MFKPELLGRLAIFMGGRAAEEVTCDSVSTGAVDDIQRATDLSFQAVAKFGLSDAIGPMSYAALKEGGAEGGMLPREGGQVGEAVESEVKKLLDGALLVAKQVVEANKKMLYDLAGELESEEKLEGAALRESLAGVEVPQSLVDFLQGGPDGPDALSR